MLNMVSGTGEIKICFLVGEDPRFAVSISSPQSLDGTEGIRNFLGVTMY